LASISNSSFTSVLSILMSTKKDTIDIYKFIDIYIVANKPRLEYNILFTLYMKEHKYESKWELWIVHNRVLFII